MDPHGATQLPPQVDPTQPRHDLVSRVDQQLGAELGIACDKNPLLGLPEPERMVAW